MSDIIENLKKDAENEDKNTLYMKLLSFVALRNFNENFEDLVKFYEDGNYFINKDSDEENFIKNIIEKCSLYDKALLHNLFKIEEILTNMLRKKYKGDINICCDDQKIPVAWWRE